MRKTRRRAMRPFGCALAVIVAAGCGPVKPRTDPAPLVGSTSNSTVAHEESHQSFSRIEELIEGRAPGVQVLRHSDGSFALRIRGVSSPASRNEPLIVIDGTPAMDTQSSHALAMVNPQDVLRIDVLKDAASTAFYGMRGANGVIVITTRQQ
jgi:TonB-dependent starch-binding outer membrane protein SusC